MILNSGVYMIRNKENGKAYIGSSNNIDRRWRTHLNQLNKNCHVNRYLQRSWNKYGSDCFTFEILEACSEEMLIEREQWYLDNHRPHFNIATSASAPMKGQTHPPETRRKISRSLLGNTYTLGFKPSQETRLKMSFARKGKPQAGGVKLHSAETKQKIRASNTGKILSEATKQAIAKAKNKPVAQLNKLTGELIKVWLSQTIAGQELGIDQRSISDAYTQRVRLINGREYTTKTAGGYAWKFAEKQEVE
jgi:group I intron endonuclease